MIPGIMSDEQIAEIKVRTQDWDDGAREDLALEFIEQGLKVARKMGFEVRFSRGVSLRGTEGVTILGPDDQALIYKDRCACGDHTQPGPHFLKSSVVLMCGCPSCDGDICEAPCLCEHEDVIRFVERAD